MDTQTRISPFLPGVGRIMATSHGAHPADAWAQVTAEQIAPIDPDVTGQRRIKANQLQNAIAAALESHHQTVQDHERDKLGADAAHILNSPAPEPYLDAAIAAIQAAAAGTDWAAHFSDPQVIAAIRVEVAGHFATSQLIEKSWHADRNPTHPAAVAFKAQHHPGMKG